MANPFSKKMMVREKNETMAEKSAREGRPGGRPTRQATGGGRQAWAKKDANAGAPHFDKTEVLFREWLDTGWGGA